jgi:hypothetical protein
MKRSYIPAVLGLMCLTFLAAPAQAGWRDWLGLGGEPQSEEPAAKPETMPPTAATAAPDKKAPNMRDEVLPDWANLSAAPVKFVIQITALDGATEKTTGVCETRRTEAKACEMFGVVPRSFSTGPQSHPNLYAYKEEILGKPFVRHVAVRMRLFAQDQTMVQLWLHGDPDTGVVDKRQDISLAQLKEGITISLFKEGYDPKSYQPMNVPSGSLFLQSVQ